MKKIGILFVLLGVLLCACGGEEKERSSRNEEGNTVCVALEIGGTLVDSHTKVADLLALLGEDYVYAEAISCVYEGMDKTYTYADAVIYTYPGEDGDCLMELYCTGNNVAAGGIRLGASKDEIVNAFGSGYIETGNLLCYENAPAAEQNQPESLYFELSDGKVIAIAVTAEHRTE